MLGGYFAPIETQLSDMTAGIKERLQGKIPVPAVKQIAKQYLVNWQAMKRYQIPLESIPPEYTIMYRPWREKYATPILILESLLVFTLLLGISLPYLYLYTGKRTQKRSLAQPQVRTRSINACTGRREYLRVVFRRKDRRARPSFLRTDQPFPKPVGNRGNSPLCTPRRTSPVQKKRIQHTIPATKNSPIPLPIQRHRLPMVGIQIQRVAE